MLEQAVAIGLVQGDDDLTITLRDELMAAQLHLLAQLAIVVDLAIADQPDGSLAVTQRLAPTFEVDDRQSAVTQGCISVIEYALSVGTAMPQYLEHRADPLASLRRVGDDAGDAAHQGTPEAGRCAPAACSLSAASKTPS